MSVTGVPGWLSNGITINEPDPDRPSATRCLQQVMVPADITGKGKRKMDEISGLPGNNRWFLFFICFYYGCVV